MSSGRSGSSSRWACVSCGALAALWDTRAPDEPTLTAAALESLGGVSGALSRHAETSLGALLPEERETARDMLLRLVTPERTRTRRSRTELLELGEPAVAARVLELLIASRLVLLGE